MPNSQNSQIVASFTDLELASEVFHWLLALMADRPGITVVQWVGKKGVMMSVHQGQEVMK